MFEIKRIGKNFVENPNWYRLGGSIPFIVFKNGFIAQSTDSNNGIIGFDIFLFAGTYTFSTKTEKNTSGYPNWYIFRKELFEVIYRGGISKTPITLDIPYSDIYFVSFEFYREGNGEIKIYDMQIERNDAATEYEKPSIKKVTFDIELFSIQGFSDYIENNYLVRQIKRETKTTDGSGNFTLSDYLSGTKAIVINNTNGEVKILDAAATISTGWNNTEVTIIYVSKTPEVIELPEETKLDLNNNINHFIANNLEKDTYQGDGTTTTFNLSKTAIDTNYQVFLNGEITDGISKTTTSFSFDEAPKNGALIEAEYNVSLIPAVVGVEVLEGEGTETLLDFITSLNIRVENDNMQARNILGEVKTIKMPETYRITLTRNMLENIEKFYNEYKDKTFRLKLLDTSTNEIEYLTPCKIVSANRDYFGRIENIDIIALDYYKA